MRRRTAAVFSQVWLEIVALGHLRSRGRSTILDALPVRWSWAATGS